MSYRVDISKINNKIVYCSNCEYKGRCRDYTIIGWCVRGKNKNNNK